ncbi:MAG: bifunctional diaminohydroxyphosphoribosylaminopyrimidine deaminase/5-amino-6-(5-phosphoribosylamino)uracil reductase RibD [Abditibacteriales bacterium]|nr:bifunctional diaminohydroxyphosphoribosylaminopyrimidine deaminase/5-amino-6-(5-phosphoribosylamino)uracil reductase RibD [Abditibacteriales bacterium]MDW8365390.1 bifunctional diaminohydroxyphosphoribosylaminopyrimidine deaminase/5-amino-6-(5-phosphoribosylamino)uracil reductase RibD [Abditibacteriales bacterium]
MVHGSRTHQPSIINRRPLTIDLSDERWMRRALALARRSKGWTSPNPCVGAVIVKGGRVVGEGFHPRAGEPHAEVFAFRQAGKQARGGTLYVTLEPCVHYGRTPPCVEVILTSGIRRVVAAMVDPDVRVNGRGLTRLQAAGVEVTCGVLEEQARKLNEDFIKFKTQGLPFVTLKIAMTLDGKIATASGESQWITGDKARAHAQRLRHEHDAILVGINTVLADDPQLTTRLRRGKDPQRIILDSRARLPLTARVLHVASSASTWVAVTQDAPQSRIRKLEQSGAKVLPTESADGRVNLRQLMKLIAAQNVMSVLIEGGGTVAWSALDAGIVDKVIFFIAPKIIGGANAVTAVEGAGRRLGEAWRLRDVRVKRMGEDVMVEGYVCRHCQ